MEDPGTDNVCMAVCMCAVGSSCYYFKISECLPIAKSKTQIVLYLNQWCEQKQILLFVWVK